MTHYRILAATAIAAALGFGALPALASTMSASIVGQVVDTTGGLAIAGASVDLTCDGQQTQHTTTTPGGAYSFDGIAPGTCIVWIFAKGYETARSPAIAVTAASGEIRFTAGMTRTSRYEQIGTIGHVTVLAQSSLQTSATINESVPASRLQTEDYMRAGDALISLPGVTTQTSSSLGDDMSISIRGFDSSETATLLDGHPIGPIGAFGNGYDYQVSPFFGLSDIETVFGSGATTIYGASTIAGAVDMQTINPTQQQHLLVEQGFGSDGKLLTGFQATGMDQKLGYALSHAVEGTDGLFPSSTIEQSGLLGTDIRSSTIAADTYTVTSDYVLRNDLAKLTYALSPKTNLLVALYSGNSWDDKSGNGDNDFLTYQENLYLTQTSLAANGGDSSVCLSNCGNPGEVDGNCTGFTQAVQSDASQGFSCLQPQKYAQLTSGPAGGGPGPWQAIRNQDYHLRLTTGAGSGQITADTFIDHYGLDYNRDVANNSFNTDEYRTAGLLLDDTFASPLHSFSFGYKILHQLHTGDVFPYFDQFGNGPFDFIVQNQAFDLTTNSVYVRDEYTPTSRWSAIGNLWFDHSQDTKQTSFDPRLSFIYRPSSDDIVRLTAGKSNSEPDPSLLYAAPSYNTTPSNINPSCGANQTQIGSVSDQNLVPETASDVELAYGRRFAQGDNVQIDFYDAQEQNALFGGNLPLSALGSTQVPPGLIQAYLNRIQSLCHNNPTQANLSVSTTYNAAGATYRGIDLTGLFNAGQNFHITAEYGVQSAFYTGVPDSILSQNVYIINSSQINDVPLDKANLGFEYANTGGFDVVLDGHYIGDNNPYNRPAFTFFNGSIAKKAGMETFTLGANNIFDTAAQRYGFIGLGVYHEENQFGTDTNAFEQNSEQFGLAPTQVFFSVTYQI